MQNKGRDYNVETCNWVGLRNWKPFWLWSETRLQRACFNEAKGHGTSICHQQQQREEDTYICTYKWQRRRSQIERVINRGIGDGMGIGIKREHVLKWTPKWHSCAYATAISARLTVPDPPKRPMLSVYIEYTPTTPLSNKAHSEAKNQYTCVKMGREELFVIHKMLLCSSFMYSTPVSPIYHSYMFLCGNVCCW